MQRLRLLGLVLIAIFALGAITSIPASAEEGGNPSILPTPTAANPLLFTSTGGKTTFELKSKEKITCESGTNKGEFSSQRLGKVTIDFEKCKANGFECHSEGDANEIILVAADVHLVAFKSGTTLNLGVALVLLNAVKLLCAGLVKVEITTDNGVIGQVDGAKDLEKVKTFELLLHQATAKQGIKTCQLTKEFCNLKEFLLLIKDGGGAFEESGIEWEEHITLGKEAEFHF